MTNPYRACLAELLSKIDYTWGDIPADVRDLMDRSRALLAQPVAKGPKPVVDYSRVTEIATEAQIRSAAQYLVKKRNCDGDLIPAIEYAIARWGRPTLQPVAEGPTVMEIIELHTWMEDEWRANNDGEDLPMVDYARAVLAKWGTND